MAKTARLQLEDAEQIALIEWSAYATISGIRVFDFLIANANGGKRSKSEAGKFKAQGVKAGVSDLFFALPMHGLAGLWIELKRPASPGRAAGTASPEQIEWITNMRAVGFAAELCVGWLAAKDVITHYIKGDLQKLSPVGCRPITSPQVVTLRKEPVKIMPRDRPKHPQLRPRRLTT